MKFKGGCNPITHLTLMDPPMEHKVHTKNNFQIPRGVLTFPLHQLDPPTVYGSIVNCALSINTTIVAGTRIEGIMKSTHRT